MTLGEALKKIREYTKLSGRELALRIGVNQYRLQKWEDGAANPKHEDTQLIFNFLKIKSLSELSEKVLNSSIASINKVVSEDEKPINETSDPAAVYVFEGKKDLFEAFLEAINKNSEIINRHSITIDKQTDIIKKQEETINFLAKKGDADGRTASSM